MSITVTADVIIYASHENLFGHYPSMLESTFGDFVTKVIQGEMLPITLRDRDGAPWSANLGLCGMILRDEVEIEDLQAVARAFMWKLFHTRRGGECLCGAVLFHLGKKIEESHR